MTGTVPIRRALLSVSDKTGIVALARALYAAGVELLSTGGTHRAIVDAGVPVREVSDYTGFPEMMDGRVKTLHPRVHGGLLGRTAAGGEDRDGAVMAAHGIEAIDLVVVNLYPFRETVARPDCAYADAVENIDIGGPAMLRSAAKNHARVAVVVDPADYPELQAALASGGTDYPLRQRLAASAYRHTAEYDAAIAGWFGTALAGAPAPAPKVPDAGFPETLALSFRRVQSMRYGENPHQAAALYTDGARSGEITCARQLHGRELSYNNVADADAALECVKAFSEPACVIVKHANPCGVGIGENALAAYEKAYATDPTSAYGGIIAINRTLDGELVDTIVARQFAEVILAPDVTDAALGAARKRKNLRVLAVGALTGPASGLDLKRVGGGLLVQERDAVALADGEPRVVTRRAPTAAERADLDFAWRVAWYVKSNAIVYARGGQTIGVGAGQMSRVISARIAAMKAAEEGLVVPGSVMASDAFFPFRDGIDAAAEAGITAVIQPGGSVRDEEVIAAADEHGMAMLFTGTRHFRH